MFYDENMDLMELFESADEGDVGAMIKCVSYISIMGDEARDILKERRTKYIKALVKKEVPAGLIWKADDLLDASLKQESVKAAMSCYYLAALNGEYHGVECIADMYYEGKGVDVDWSVARSIFWSAIRLFKSVGNEPSTLAFYKLGTIAEESAEDRDDIEYAIYLYELAIEVAGEFASVDDYAVKAKEALWRLAA